MSGHERPSYAVDSLETQLAAIRGKHRTTSAKDLYQQWQLAVRDELTSMRRAYDEPWSKTNAFWLAEGFRTLTDARGREYRLAVFRDVLARPDIAYVRCGRDFMPDTYLVYARDPKSPTGVEHVGSQEIDGDSTALLDASKSCRVSPTEGLNKSGAGGYR